MTEDRLCLSAELTVISVLNQSADTCVNPEMCPKQPIN